MRLIGRVQEKASLVAISVLALGLAACGGGDTTTTVTSTVTVPAGDGAAGAASFVGTTSQNLPISFAATPSGVLTLSFD